MSCANYEQDFEIKESRVSPLRESVVSKFSCTQTVWFLLRSLTCVLTSGYSTMKNDVNWRGSDVWLKFSAEFVCKGWGKEGCELVKQPLLKVFMIKAFDTDDRLWRGRMHYTVHTHRGNIWEERLWMYVCTLYILHLF